MGISIDDAIETLLDTRSYGTADIAKSVAIDTMRKYQKIEEIVNDRYGKPVFKTLDEVIKVVEDGNDD